MHLTDHAVADLAEQLLEARSGGPALSRNPPASPLSEADGYRVQNALLDRYLAAGESLAGYKIGLTSPSARAVYGAASPAWGFLLQSAILDGPRNPDLPYTKNRKVEAEFAFILGEDLPPHEVSATEVLDATSNVFLAAEIVDSRWLGAVDLGGLVADDVSNAAVALGPEVARSEARSADVRGSVRVNDRESHGTSSQVMGAPVNAVAWLASELSRHGRRLQAGHVIMSGSFCTPLDVEPADDAIVDFGHLGQLYLKGELG